MIQVNLDQVFPDCIKFLNEKGEMVNQAVEFDWLPYHMHYLLGVGS